MIKAGANISQANTDGQMAVHYAAMKGNLECLKVLIEAGADVNAVMKNSLKPEKSSQLSPAHLAATGRSA